jgi:hypothetical protein
MAVQAIAQPAPAGKRQIFTHGERVDIADAAAIQIARRRVMNAVRPPPQILGGQGEHPNDAANPVIHQPMAKERSVATIVLDHE